MRPTPGSRTLITTVASLSLFLPIAALSHEGASVPTGAFNPLTRRTLVIYNEAYPDENGDGTGDSEELALFYRGKRGIPPSHLLALDCRTSEGYGVGEWTEFYDEVITPLHGKLAELGQKQIYFLAVCYGVPITIEVGGSYSQRSLDGALCAPFSLGDRDAPNFPLMWHNNPYREGSPSVPPDHGRFDHSYTFGYDDIYCVTRLEGDHVGWAKELVERALYGERYIHTAGGHHNGYGYVDTRYGEYTDEELAGYPFGYQTYANADKSMAFGTYFVEDGDWELLWEFNETEIGEDGAYFHDGSSAETAPAAMWYEGWYNYVQYHDVWEWLVGAVACDLNSNSGAGVRRPQSTTSFLGQAFFRGLTAGAGVTGEPFLNGHYKPEVLLYYILNGYTFAEASFASNPTLCWRDHAIGDPLYAPTKPKVPDIDSIPPPSPFVEDFAPGTGGDTARTILVSIETAPSAPDLFVCRIDWGLTPDYGNVADYGTVYHTLVERTLEGLLPGTTYHYTVTIADPAGNTTATEDYTFTTEPRED